MLIFVMGKNISGSGGGTGRSGLPAIIPLMWGFDLLHFCRFVVRESVLNDTICIVILLMFYE